MTQYAATHTINYYLAVEVAPRAFVAETGNVLTRTSATKWGGFGGMEIVEYTGPGVVEVSALQLSKAQSASARELADIAEINW